MSNWVFEYFKSVDIHLVADISIAIILVTWAISLWSVAKDKHPRFVEFSPTLLTSLGILGTFVGITLGLISFNFESQLAIDQSLPDLLSGLKMAFISSIFGMATSLMTRSFAMWHQAGGVETQDEVGVDELYQAICQTNKILLDTHKSLASKSDLSVLTQVKKMREDLQEGFQKERIAFQEFSETVSEAGSKQLVEALDEVTRNFNGNLTTQFGENFTRLDSSVSRLVLWQQEYRQQMEIMKSEFELAAEGISASKRAIDSIQRHSAEIPNLMNTLKKVSETGELPIPDSKDQPSAMNLLKLYLQSRIK
ncbi:MAG: hypothetical protein R8M38_03705 [Mariprofundaceae bacterium]